MVRGTKRVWINEKPWDVIFIEKTHPKLHGDCEWRTRRIRVFKEQHGNRYDPETVVHELLHALFPKMKEKDVLRAGAELTSALCDIDIHFTNGLVRGNKHI